MPTPDPSNPMAECPRCRRAGFVGRDREITGDQAITVFKCHVCHETWRVPDTTPGPPTIERRELFDSKDWQVTGTTDVGFTIFHKPTAMTACGETELAAW